MLQQQRMSCLNRSSTAFSWCKTLTAFHWHDYSSQSEAVSAWEIFVKRPTALTPPTITPRNVAFRGGTLQERWWLGGNPVATAFYNSMSVIFPQGVAFFIASVRAFRDDVPPEFGRASCRERVCQYV